MKWLFASLCLAAAPTLLATDGRVRSLNGDIFEGEISIDSKLGLVITNLGTMFRLRGVFTLILVAFAAYGFDVYERLWQSLRHRWSRSFAGVHHSEHGSPR